MHESTSSLPAWRPSSSTHQTLPEFPVVAMHETARLDRGVVVVQLLHDVRAKAERHPDEKVRRAVLRKLESLRYVVDCWGAMPPRPEQVSAMLELLVGLQETSEVIPPRCEG